MEGLSKKCPCKFSLAFSSNKLINNGHMVSRSIADWFYTLYLQRWCFLKKFDPQTTPNYLLFLVKIKNFINEQMSFIEANDKKKIIIKYIIRGQHKLWGLQLDRNESLQKISNLVCKIRSPVSWANFNHSVYICETRYRETGI